MENRGRNNRLFLICLVIPGYLLYYESQEMIPKSRRFSLVARKLMVLSRILQAS